MEADEAAFEKEVGCVASTKRTSCAQSGSLACHMTSSYKTTVYSPRVKLGMPLWWDNDKPPARRRWGRVGLALVLAYAASCALALFAWPYDDLRGLMLVASPTIALLSAYLMWMGCALRLLTMRIDKLTQP